MSLIASWELRVVKKLPVVVNIMLTIVHHSSVRGADIITNTT